MISCIFAPPTLVSGELLVPREIEIVLPALPRITMLLTALARFERACPPSGDDASQADLAFPPREQSSADQAAERRDRAQRLCRHAFASWWANLLSGYQDFLKTAGADVRVGTVDAVLHADGLLDSREPALRPLLEVNRLSMGLCMGAWTWTWTWRMRTCTRLTWKWSRGRVRR